MSKQSQKNYEDLLLNLVFQLSQLRKLLGLVLLVLTLILLTQVNLLVSLPLLILCLLLLAQKSWRDLIK